MSRLAGWIQSRASRSLAGASITSLTAFVLSVSPLIPCSVVAEPLGGFAKIEGAAGLRLGAVFEGEGLATGSTGPYKFTPAQPIEGFEYYYVSITPKTHRIYEISIGGSFVNAKALHARMEEITKALTDKYGPAVTRDPGMGAAWGLTKFIRQGTREIEFSTNTFGSASASIWYRDCEIQKAAQGELPRTDPPVKKPKDSGL